MSWHERYKEMKSGLGLTNKRWQYVMSQKVFQFQREYF